LEVKKRMEDFFVFNIWGILLILFGPTVYIFLRFAKVDQNLIGFIFGPFIILLPMIGFYLVISQRIFIILCIILFFLIGLLSLREYFLDKKRKQ
jgi:hypothetical protein